MLSTPQEAAVYIVNTIKELSPIENHNLDEDIVESVVEDLFYEQLGQQLTEEDMTKIEQHPDDDEYFREYCQIHIKNYYTILEEITKNIIADYLIEAKEIQETEESDLSPSTNE